jgi:hypothetical protein
MHTPLGMLCEVGIICRGWDMVVVARSVVGPRGMDIVALRRRPPAAQRRRPRRGLGTRRHSSNLNVVAVPCMARLEVRRGEMYDPRDLELSASLGMEGF